MPDVTGTLRAEFAGRTYALRLTTRGLAQLQAEYGVQLEPILGKPGDVEAGIAPDMAAMLRVVEIALKRGEPGLSHDEVLEIADDLLTADLGLFGRLIEAAFPATQDAPDALGNARRQRKAKAA